MACDLLDWRCIFVSEIVGSVVLTIIIAAMLYFVVASKLRLGFDTTIALSVPIILIGGLAFAGFSAVYAFSTVIVALMLAYIFNQLVGNR